VLFLPFQRPTNSYLTIKGHPIGLVKASLHTNIHRGTAGADEKTTKARVQM
jgi:hypothetical protein